MQKRDSKNSLWAMATLFLTFSLIPIIYQAKLANYFVDEIVNHEAALSFFHRLDYSSSLFLNRPFDAHISTGILSTWPVVLAWSTGGTLLAARLVLAAYILVLYFALATRATMRLGSTAAEAVVFASVLWLSMMLVVPNWQNFILNLGELWGFLSIATGFFFLKNRTRLAFLFFGLAVWQGKLVYLPLVLLLWAGSVLNSWREQRFSFKKEVIHGIIFFAPLVIWCALIFVRYDFNTLLGWFSDLHEFTLKGGSGADRSKHVVGLYNRLHSDRLEWIQYHAGFKARILLLSFAPYFCVAAAAFYKIEPFHKRKDLLVYLLLSLFGLAFYSAWWFLWHPTMWVRHYQPALYLSLTIMALLFYQFCSQKISQKRSVIFVSLGFFLIICLGYSYAKAVTPNASYAQSCLDVFTSPCIPKP